MIEFSKDGGTTWSNLDDFGLIAQPGHEHAFIPDVINSSAVIGGADGEIDFGGRLGARPFNLPLCFPYATSVPEMQLLGRTFAAYLSDGRGRPVTLWMRFVYESDKYYSCRYNGIVIPTRQFETASFLLPMIASDPFAYQTDLSTEITWDSDVSMDSDLTFDDVFSHEITAAGTIDVHNFGGLDLWPVIQIVGTFTTFSITANNRTLVYNEALAAGTLMIDCAKMTAKLGSVNKNNKVSGQWIKLLKGVNEVAINGTDLDIEIEFQFHAKFL